MSIYSGFVCVRRESWVAHIFADSGLDIQKNEKTKDMSDYKNKISIYFCGIDKLFISHTYFAASRSSKYS